MCQQDPRRGRAAREGSRARNVEQQDHVTESGGGSVPGA